MAIPPTVTLSQLAAARSSRLGQRASIGVVAHTQAGYDFLSSELTATRVQNHFARWGVVQVERYVLPRVWAFHFVLNGPWEGPANPMLRFDTEGRLLAMALLELELPRPDSITQMTEQLGG
ncbi:MAG: hypothetical protein A2W31_18875 [Planctomycetes bacterium RBG_16_64_10]|nr:MAG: hypothetical protein A2W31_18875 [Planctomycetes bacterium RBG_16_64_10]